MEFAEHPAQPEKRFTSKEFGDAGFEVWSFLLSVFLGKRATCGIADSN